MRIVIDSSPLIAFAILDRLDLLEQIFSESLIPQAVFNEISVWSKPYFLKLKDFSENRIRCVQNTNHVYRLTEDVDLGEAEAIVLALENEISDILIDDAKGRRTARLNGLCPIGTVGVLLEAKRLCYINEIKSYMNKLLNNKIRISKNLYQQALQLAAER